MMSKNNVKIMLIDDDPINNLLNTKLLKKHSLLFDIQIEIIEYQDGQSAIEAIQSLIKNSNVLPDIILLDINMPIMNGWDFLDRYIKFNLPITLYMLTSSIAQDDINKAKQYKQIKKFMIKPLSDENLNTIFENL
ncbi:MAG: response regulator [Microscillaceae bacterium]|nr:response regulator [Microscillaceae bacterium]